MKIKTQFNKIDIMITSWMRKEGILLLRLSLGLVFIWFGMLKPFGMSPAQTLVENTI